MKGLTNRIFLTLVCVLVAGSVRAQAIKDIRINEIQVINTDGYEDDYGHRVGWIELFNSGYSQVDVGGAYLKVRDKEYRIPKNDPRTVMAPQGYLIFFAEGTAAKGTFHTNFTLLETDYIAFYDQSGKGKAIDSLAYRHADMIENVSYGWFEDHDGELKLMNLPVTTPMATNDTLEKKPRDEHFREADPSGGIMAITAMTVVFLALILLYVIFKSMGRFQTNLARRKMLKQRLKEHAEYLAKHAVVPNVPHGKSGPLTGEELAAIAYALYQYSQDLHDIENTVLTIRSAARSYSPWSSKIYGLRQLPTKK